MPSVSSFKRRSFLASAALAAAVPVSLAGPAAAAQKAEPQDPIDYGCVAHLLSIPERRRDLDWLRRSLQHAVELELATIPPYLCGWWSIIDRTCEAARLIRRIVGDEMYHLGVVCNLLVAVGGRPRIKEALASYPGPLPGGVRPEVTVYLSGLTKSYVHDVMMAIEAPEDPLTQAGDAASTVGDFYTALLTAFRTLAPELSTQGQLSERIGSDVLEPIDSLSAVERAIDIIKEQGEGTVSSPAEQFDDDQPAHYYAFGEIYHGRRLRKVGRTWQFTGEPVPFPDVRPMGRVPIGGWPSPPARVRKLLDHFDATFMAVLTNLETAWADGDPRALRVAVHAMHGMENPALELMEIEIPDAPGTYGPQFRTSLPSGLT